VVGNLTVGGTGKTPVVEKFARALRDRGRKVAILSRGYKSKSTPRWKKWWWGLTHAEEPPPRVVSDGETVLLDSEQAGDEPYMLARNLPGVIVLVDKNRVKAGRLRDQALRLRHARPRRRLPVPAAEGPAEPAAGGQDQPLRQRPPPAARHPARAGEAPAAGVLRLPHQVQRRARPELEATIQKHNPGVDIIECAHRPQYLQRFGNDGAPGR
jgi:tetraacyldisaccharide 4'-kinase